MEASILDTIREDLVHGKQRLHKEKEKIIVIFFRGKKNNFPKYISIHSNLFINKTNEAFL